MKKLISILFSRMVIVGLLILLQLLVLMAWIWQFSEYSEYIYTSLVIFSLAVALKVLSSDENPSYKIAWLVPILLFPVFGGPLYLLFGSGRITRGFKEHAGRIVKETQSYLVRNTDAENGLAAVDPEAERTSRYITEYGGYPLYQNSVVTYFPSGEAKFEALKEQLEKAEHFIFMEYFIIGEGYMWNSLRDILIRKAAEGVDVRIMYDDIGSLNTLPYKYDLYLGSLGIKCRVFNQFKPVASVRMNNRDHRKIVVIDGHTGFTGGINLADEYINRVERCGHWKDTAVMIKGEAVWNLTVMFLRMWCESDAEREDFLAYAPHTYHAGPFVSDGFVQPYGDSPLDDEIVGENVYLNMINRAKNYVWISSPYLIIDNELTSALCLAAKSGVDVRIVCPHVPDKWYVHMMTRSAYPFLIKNGVKVYEYTPGFNHSKTFLVDDRMGTVGTINLDYRSLYLHFECGCWMYGCGALQDLKSDYLAMLDKCAPYTEEDCRRVRWPVRLMRSLLRVFAPLM